MSSNRTFDDLFTLIADAAEGKTQPTMALMTVSNGCSFATPFEPMRGLVDEMLAMEGGTGHLFCLAGPLFPVVQCANLWRNGAGNYRW